MHANNLLSKATNYYQKRKSSQRNMQQRIENKQTNAKHFLPPKKRLPYILLDVARRSLWDDYLHKRISLG